MKLINLKQIVSRHDQSEPDQPNHELSDCGVGGSNAFRAVDVYESVDTPRCKPHRDTVVQIDDAISIRLGNDSQTIELIVQRRKNTMVGNKNGGVYWRRKTKPMAAQHHF